jgi:hypothetical protein
VAQAVWELLHPSLGLLLREAAAAALQETSLLVQVAQVVAVRVRIQQLELLVLLTRAVVAVRVRTIQAGPVVPAL